MDRAIIEGYIEKGLELELLDKLNSYVITGFDDRFLNVVKILVILQERARIDWYQPNQALVKVVLKALPDMLGPENANNLNSFIHTLEETALLPYINISYLIRQLIIGIEDQDSKIADTGVSQEILMTFKERLQQLNVLFLEKVIGSESDFQSVIGVFYNCVDKLGAERKTFLIPTALELFRGYIKENSIDYLTHFIRPYYTGTNKFYIDHYFHVPEPFHQQIFSPTFTFEDFLIVADKKNSNENLLRDIKDFYTTLLQRDPANGDRKVILFSEEMRHLSHEIPTKTLKISSIDHILVRQECKPPLFKIP